MPRFISRDLLRRIVRLSNNGYGQKDIATVIGVTQGAVSKVLKRARLFGSPAQRPRGHRPKSTSPREDRAILRLCRTNRFMTASRIRAEFLRRTGRHISVRTVRRRLLVAGYKSRRPARCPRLTDEHRQRRRRWARRHRQWDIRHWSHCLFTDESRFTLFHTDGRLRVRRREGERFVASCVVPTDGNRRPSVTVWGGFHFRGKSPLVIVEGTVNQERYQNILRDNFLPWARATFQNNYVLVQDNAPAHTARNTRAFLENEDVEVMDWPSRSPDLNPIEHIWDQIGVFLRDMDNPPTTVPQLRQAVLQAWDAVRPENLRKLVRSMPRRVRATAAARGANTRY